MPRLRSTGFPHCPTSLRREKFWQLRAPIWSTSAYSATDPHLVRLEDLGDDGQPGLLPRFGEEPEPLLLEPLEGVGRGPRLEGPSAQEVGARRLDVLGHRPQLLPRLDRAGPGHHADSPAADRDAVDADDGVGRRAPPGSRA